MSVATPFPTDSLTSLDADSLELRLGFLIRRYLAARSAALAGLVVHQLELLRDHPDLSHDQERRCVYRKMLRQWRWLEHRELRADCDTTPNPS